MKPLPLLVALALAFSLFAGAACAFVPLQAPEPQPPAIEVTPDDVLFDEPAAIRLAGFPPTTEVTITARMRLYPQGFWASQAVFLTDEQGAADLTATAPLTGTYATTDAMGLFWSMVYHPVPDRSFKKIYDPTTPFQVTLEAYLDGSLAEDGTVTGEPVTTALITRRSAAPGVRVEEVKDGALFGKLYLPPSPAPAEGYPVVITLSGSEGGLPEVLSALLASHGYAAMPVAYVRPLLGTSRTPIDQFDAAIEWLQNRPEIDSERIGVMGPSLGGELALLLGSMHPEIKAVISINGSYIMWNTDTDEPQWTYHGEDLPVATFDLPTSLRMQQYKGEPIRRTPFFLEALKDWEKVEPAVIPIERIQGPILFISGDDDGVWPASRFAEMAVERLEEKGFPYEARNVVYPDAGHLALLPYFPPVIIHNEPGKHGYLMDRGGNPAGTVAAAADVWPQIIDFLDSALAR